MAERKNTFGRIHDLPVTNFWRQFHQFHTPACTYMCMYVYTCAHTCTCMCVHVYVCMYVCECTCAYVHAGVGTVHVCVYTCVCLSVCINVCVCLCILCLCVHTCMCGGVFMPYEPYLHGKLYMQILQGRHFEHLQMPF